MRPRILFYTHDHYGLGHLRRALALAGDVARRRPDAAMLLLTGASPPESFERPATLDYVKLPSTAQAELYRHVAPKAPASSPLAGLVALRTALLGEAIRAFAPLVVLVEHLPLGLWGELRAPLTGLRRTLPEAQIFLGLRDVPDPPEEVLAGWRSGGQFEFIERVYDRVLIFGDRAVCDVVRECGFPPGVAARSTYCGYVARPPAGGGVEAVRPPGGGPLVVVTTGGGRHGGALLQAYLEACRAGALGEVRSFLTLGPRLPRAERDRAVAAAAGLRGVEVVSFADDLDRRLAAADVVVTMAGYNTVVEVLRLGRPAVFVPRAGQDREQAVRAERLAALGLGQVVRPEAMAPAGLARAIRAALAAPPSPNRLDLGGLETAGALLAGALP